MIFLIIWIVGIFVSGTVFSFLIGMEIMKPDINKKTGTDDNYITIFLWPVFLAIYIISFIIVFAPEWLGSKIKKLMTRIKKIR